MLKLFLLLLLLLPLLSLLPLLPRLLISYAADAGKALAAMSQERVDERVLGIAGRGMNDEPGRFVDHQNAVRRFAFALAAIAGQNLSARVMISAFRSANADSI